MADDETAHLALIAQEQLRQALIRAEILPEPRDPFAEWVIAKRATAYHEAALRFAPPPVPAREPAATPAREDLEARILPFRNRRSDW